jgi:predicted ATPase/tetratricopeptide (TPR) repeat protein
MRIGERFEIGEPLAQGGMGTVFIGTDLDTGESVAIKQLKRDLIGLDPTLIERFRREGEALSRLEHPHIIRSIAAFEENDEHYLVMEYLSGGTLRAWLKRDGRLPVHRVVAIGLDLADALARAHHLKIIHRDLKPENVLLAADGSVRLTDFGVATSGGLGARLTEAGHVPGTFAYLAPESFSDQPSDARSDIWSFGVLLFELLTGQHPFDAQTLEGTMGAILTRPTPDLERLRPDAPIALIDLIYRMLEKDRALRIPTMRLVAAELEAVLNGSPPVLPQSSAYLSISTTSNAPRLGTGPLGQRLRHNLPAQGMRFIGRAAELQDLQRALETAETRLITLFGIGGMGKTRLAVELGRQNLDRGFADGIWFVDLAPMTGVGQLVPAIAQAVGFSIFPGDDPQRQLHDYLHNKNMLLIADNCETAPDAAAVIGALIDATERLKIVATSRERLNLERELIFALDGLPVPPRMDPAFGMPAQRASAAPAQPLWNGRNGQDDAPTQSFDLAETAPSAFDVDAMESAVQLFMQGAQRVRQPFALTAATLPDVIRICRAVDGLPLGILLASAWVADFTVAEIADEVTASLANLGTELHDIPERHRSLWAIADFSWGRSSRTDQAIFARLTVFHGGFSRDAAQAVAGASLRSLMALGARSLVRRAPSGRYAIHELLRQYGAAHLAADPATQAQAEAAHTRYFMQMLVDAAPALRGPQQVATLQMLDADIPNLRAAWGQFAVDAWMAALPNAAFALWHYYFYFRQPYDADPWLGTLLERIATAPHTPERDTAEGMVRILYAFVDWQRAHHGSAGANLARGAALLKAGGDEVWIATGQLMADFLNVNLILRFDVADEALAARQTAYFNVFKQAGNVWLQAVARLCQSSTAFRMGDPVEGRAHSYDALRFARLAGDQFMIGWIYTMLSQHLTDAGFFAEALMAGQQAEAVYDQLALPTTLVRYLFSLSQAHLALGELREAERYTRKVIGIAQNTGNRTRLFSAYALLNTIAWTRGELDQTAEYARMMIQIARQGTSKNLLATGLTSSAYSAIMRGDYQVADENLREAFEYAREIADRSALIDIVIGFGFLYGAAYGEPERGIALIGSALAVPDPVPEARMFAERFLDALRPMLPPEALEAALADGRARTFEDTIAALAVH